MSNRATATYLELRESLTQRTASSTFNVFLCNNERTLADKPEFLSSIKSKSQNFTVPS